MNLKNCFKSGPKTKIRELPITISSHDLKLKGKVLLPDDASADSPVPAAVLCHGFGASQRAMRSSARILARQGVASLIFDFRGHGSSEGAMDGKTVDDVVSAWNTLKQFPEVDTNRMGLIGHSLGAMSAIMAAEKVESPRALIALSCPGETDAGAVNELQPDFGKWGHMANKIMEYPGQGAFPWLNGIAAVMSRLFMYVLGYWVRVNLKMFFKAISQMKMSDVLRKLDECAKLFVFCEGDNVTPCLRSLPVYESACEPKMKLLARGGCHTTPLLPGSLRSQWTSWAVRALKD